MKKFKSGQSLRLSGSSAESSIETEISAKENLYDGLTRELEEAERRLDEKSLQRIGFVRMPTCSSRPVYPRWLLICLALAVAVILVLFLVYLMEWMDPTIKRAGDILLEIPGAHIIPIPDEAKKKIQSPSLKASLESLFHSLFDLIRDKKNVVVQLTSSSEPQDRNAICDVLAKTISETHLKSCILSVSSEGKQKGKYTHPSLFSSDPRPLWDQVEDLKKDFSVIILDVDLPTGSLMGSNLVSFADMACFVLSANRSSQEELKMIKPHLSSLSHQKVFFILNNVRESLPAWLRER